MIYGMECVGGGKGVWRWRRIYLIAGTLHYKVFIDFLLNTLIFFNKTHILYFNLTCCSTKLVLVLFQERILMCLIFSSSNSLIYFHQLNKSVLCWHICVKTLPYFSRYLAYTRCYLGFTGFSSIYIDKQWILKVWIQHILPNFV